MEKRMVEMLITGENRRVSEKVDKALKSFDYKKIVMAYSLLLLVYELIK